MKDDINLTQPLMEKLFPEIKKHKEPMAFSLSGDGFGTKSIISVLLRPKRDGVEYFKNSSGSYEIKTICELINEYGTEKLSFRLEFQFKNRILDFDGIINPRNTIQGQIINSLKHNENVFIWVADNEGCVVKVVETGWNYDTHKDVLDRLLDR